MITGETSKWPLVSGAISLGQRQRVSTNVEGEGNPVFTSAEALKKNVNHVKHCDP